MLSNKKVVYEILNLSKTIKIKKVISENQNTFRVIGVVAHKISVRFNDKSNFIERQQISSADDFLILDGENVKIFEF